MSHRFRLFAAGFALIFSLGVVYAGASAATSARISVHLTSKSFTAARAGSVKVQYKFSSKSSRFAYVLSRKAGSAWSRVSSVSKPGSFRGSHTMTVKSVFGSRPITAGQYRLKLSSSANSVTLSFTVAAPATVKPEAGEWRATLNVPATGSGESSTINGLYFTVAPGQASVSPFGLTYNAQGVAPPNYFCTWSNAWSQESVPSPITDGQFSNPPGALAWTDAYSGEVSARATFHGTFDSATTAHGTVQATVHMWTAYIPGLTPLSQITCNPATTETTGTFTWTASWHSS